jgi:hypothetical protein
MPFVAQKGNPWPLRCDDVDPDGNELMLHHRYAPYE